MREIAVRENHRSWMPNSLPAPRSRFTANSPIILDNASAPLRILEGMEAYQDPTPPTTGIPAHSRPVFAVDAPLGLRAPLRKHSPNDANSVLNDQAVQTGIVTVDKESLSVRWMNKQYLRR